VVQQGDTLFSLARRYGATVEDLQRANNLTDDNIYVGQQLIIPVP
jgi:LysM repeat protein